MSDPAIEAIREMWSAKLDECARLRTERDEANAESLEQARLLGMSADREDKLRAELAEVIKVTDEFWQTLCHYDHDDISTNWDVLRKDILAKRKANHD